MIDNTGTPFNAVADGKHLGIIPSMANRHGLIAGATGTGKTCTLQNLAETFSAMGVPVFATDIKGDLSGVAKAGGGNVHFEKSIADNNLLSCGFEYKECPVCFWDVFGEQGHPLRTTVSEMGPMLLSRILDLNDTQSDVLSMVFRIADDQQLLLLDLKDLRKMLEEVGNNRAQYTTSYGTVAPATIGAIQRSLLTLESQGGDKFFGEPAIDIYDFMQTRAGRGVINIMASDKIVNSPKVYTSFLLYLLSELYEQLPEVGDLDKPKLVFFFDEAHMLFNGINKVAAETFRANPAFNTAETITQMGVGEALVSFLDPKGVPCMVERARILPPQGQAGALTPDERQRIISTSMVYGKYDRLNDRVSAYEILSERMEHAMQEKEQALQQKEEEKRLKEEAKQQREEERLQAAEERKRKAEERERQRAKEKSLGGSLQKMVVTKAKRELVNEAFKLGRGLLGSLLKGRK